MLNNYTATNGTMYMFNLETNKWEKVSRLSKLKTYLAAKLIIFRDALLRWFA